MPNVKSIDIKLCLWQSVEASCFSTTTADAINTARPCWAACDWCHIHLDHDLQTKAGIWVVWNFDHSPVFALKCQVRPIIINLREQWEVIAYTRNLDKFKYKLQTSDWLNLVSIRDVDSMHTASINIVQSLFDRLVPIQNIALKPLKSVDRGYQKQ